MWTTEVVSLLRLILWFCDSMTVKRIDKSLRATFLSVCWRQKPLEEYFAAVSFSLPLEVTVIRCHCLCTHSMCAEGRHHMFFKVFQWFWLIYWSQSQGTRTSTEMCEILKNYDMHIQSSLCFISPSPTPPAPPTPLHAVRIAHFSYLFYFLLFLAPNGGNVHAATASTDKRETSFFSCGPLVSPKSSMGHGNSFFLHMLVRSPFCSSLQGCTELPG